jgi:hypothetical protein
MERNFRPEEYGACLERQASSTGNFQAPVEDVRLEPQGPEKPLSLQRVYKTDTVAIPAI